MESLDITTVGFNVAKNFFEKLTKDSVILHISHNDLDGYGASYFIRNYFKNFPNKILLLNQHNLNYGEFLPYAEESISEWVKQFKENVYIIITDFGPNQAEINKLQELVEDRWLVMDHHGTGLQLSKMYSSNYYLDTNFCGAYLTYAITEMINTKMTNTIRLYKLASLINTYDMWRKEDELFRKATTISNLIRSNPFHTNKLTTYYMDMLFEEIVPMILESSSFEVEMRFPYKLQKLMKKIAVEFKDDVLLKLIDDPDVSSVVKAAVLHNNDAFNLYWKDTISFKNTNRDYDIMVFKDLNTSVTQYLFDFWYDYHTEYNNTVFLVINTKKGECSIRSRNEKASEVATHLGGGGHPNAVGCKIIAEDTMQAVLTRLKNWK